MITITLSQVSSDAPGKRGMIFNEKRHECADMKAALAWLESDYGISQPKRIHDGNSVFVDTKDGGTKRIGFLASRWQKHCDNPRRSYWETNWVSFHETTHRAVDVRELLAA